MENNLKNDENTDQKIASDSTGDSILDKIMDSYREEYLTNFNPQEILANLFKILNDREKTILKKRYGLTGGDEKTLEEIGKEFKVTRERIRQIENAALQKVKSHQDKDKLINSPLKGVLKILEEHGGILREDSLITKLLLYSGENIENRLIAKFIINQLLGEKIKLSQENKDYYKAWKLMSFSVEFLEETVNSLISLFSKHNQPVAFEKLVELIKTNEFFKQKEEKINKELLMSFLEITKKIEANPLGEWGLVEWGLVNLKKINDKIYLVLKNEGQPMHFKKIAEKINELLPSRKKANPATIHNELILDDKYVLIGRGIYALKEWGYQPGQVAEVIIDILKQAGRPLTRQEIVEAVMTKRQVKESTINLALVNKKNFKKVDGKYSLADLIQS